MRKSLNNLTIILLCLIITLTSINISALVENIDIATIVDMFDFSMPTKNIDIPPYEKNSLIVTVDNNNINTYGAYKTWTNGNIYILKYRNEKECKNAYEQLQANKSIQSIEYDGTYKIATNGKIYEKADFKNTPKNIPYISQEEETNGTKNRNKDDVIVALIDTGYDQEQENNRIINTIANFSKGAKDNSIHDENGHGTSMANIILDNSSENVKVMPIKVADKDGLAPTSSIYKAIMYAIEQKVNVINISMASYKSGKSELVARAVTLAKEKGIFVVVSAGNENSDVTEYTPANSNDAITVSAVNSNKEKMSYSNYGEAVDFSAYGKVEAKTIGNEKVKVDGTSVSSAIVSLIIAQYKVENKEANYEDIYNVLVKSAEDLGDRGKDSVYGHGVLCRDNIEGLESFAKGEKPALYTADWKNMSEEELDEIISESSSYVVAKFIEQLKEDEKQVLLSKDTKFKRHFTMSDGDTGITNKYDTYYDYIKTVDTDIAKIQSGPIISVDLDHEYKDDDGDWTFSTTRLSIEFKNNSDYSVEKYSLDGGDYEWIADSQVDEHNPKHTIETDGGNKYFRANLNLTDSINPHTRAEKQAKDPSNLNGDFTNIGDAGSTVQCTGSSKKVKNIGLQLCVDGRKLNVSGPVSVCMKTKQNNSIKETIPATCTEKGTTVYVCTYCSQTYNKKNIAKLGHDWGAWQRIQEPMCFDNGLDSRRCKRLGCSATEEKTIAAYNAHAYPTDYTYKDNSGISRGERYQDCTRCGENLITQYLVVVNAETGIAGVTGGGYYSAGNWVTLGATVRNAYDFTNYSTTNPFIMPSNAVNVTAGARLALTNIGGAVVWNDQSNKFSSRPGAVTVTLHEHGDPGFNIIKRTRCKPNKCKCSTKYKCISIHKYASKKTIK